MRKNGFTLIELLAVIIILAIVALIATPIIMEVIEESRHQSNLSEVELIIGGAETLFASSSLSGTDITMDGKTNIYDKISLSSGKPETGVVIMNDKGDVGVAFYLDNKCYKKEITDEFVTVDESITSVDECVVPVLPAELTDMAEFRSYTAVVSSSVKSLVFEVNKQMNAAEIEANYALNWDVSKYNDKSVMMFFDGTTLRVQAKSNILAPQDMSGNGYLDDAFGLPSSLDVLNLSALDTSQVTDMNYMFSRLLSLKALDLSNFNTENVTNMTGMFYGLSSLTSLNVNNLNTSKVTNMDYMFYDLRAITNLDLSSLDTSNVTSMYRMFRLPGDGPVSIDVSSFNTSNVTDMREMFYGTENMQTIDVSNFDFSKVGNNIIGMFNNSLASYNHRGGIIYVKSLEDATLLYNYGDHLGFKLLSNIYKSRY